MTTHRFPNVVNNHRVASDVDAERGLPPNNSAAAIETPRPEQRPSAPAVGQPSDPAAEVDPFDIERLRLSQDFSAELGAKEILTTVPVRKPPKDSFIQCHPDEAYRLPTGILELREAGEFYLVDRTLWSELSTEPTFGPRLLVTTITRQGALFLWPIRLPGRDGKLDGWNSAALAAADKAKQRWIRIAANMDRGTYDVIEAPGQLEPPTWPQIPFGELLRIAFSGRRIDSHEHVVLQRLRGEI